MVQKNSELWVFRDSVSAHGKQASQANKFYSFKLHSEKTAVRSVESKCRNTEKYRQSFGKALKVELIIGVVFRVSSSELAE